jgi:hypothetical protein
MSENLKINALKLAEIVEGNNEKRNFSLKYFPYSEKQLNLFYIQRKIMIT